MNLVVTGAAGFLGKSVVVEAIRAGHTVTAITRQSMPAAADPPMHAAVRWVQLDIRDGAKLHAVLRGADAVLHLAVSSNQQPGARITETGEATLALLSQMQCMGIRRIVCVSSLAVYDFLHIAKWSILDEASGTEAEPSNRDEYCRAKLLQEELIRADPQVQWTIIRPGVIIGPGRCWTDRLGVRLSSRLWCCVGNSALLPVTFVANCARAVVLAAEHDQSIGAVLNVVDDDLPTQRQYRRHLAWHLKPRPIIIALPLGVAASASRLASLAARTLGLRRRLPQILRPASLAARCKPLRYSNARAKKILGWAPEFGIDKAMLMSVGPAQSTGGDNSYAAHIPMRSTVS